MSAEEFKTRLEATKREIARVEAEMESLGQAKDRAISAGDGATAVKLKHQVDVLQKPLEDLVITKAAFEAKLRIYKGNEAEALKITGVLADDLYPQGIRHYEKLRALHAEMKSTIENTDQLNEKMVRLANEYRQLTGDKLLTPAIPVPPALYSVVDAKFDVAPPKTFDTRVASRREEERLADLFKEQEPEVAKILKRAGQAWPNCPACGARMLAQRQGPNDPAYGISEDGKRAFANFRCQKHSQWTRNIVFPPPPPAPGARYPIPEDSAPVQSVFAVPPRNDGHGLAQPGLTNQNKGGKKAT
jgi:hypothetical protein